MRTATSVLLFLLALAAFAQTAPGAVVVRSPVDDVGFPFWCDWGYDWDERCYRDGGARLPVGGVDDKVWRSGLGFSLAGIPAAATVDSARLRLYFDGSCVAPQRRAIPCPGADFALDAHRITSIDWYHEREPEFYAEVEDGIELSTSSGAHWLSWDLTSLVRDWISERAANGGVLLSLADWQEDFGTGGPYFPSMSFADSSLRPRLVVVFTSPTGPAP
jgi:TGF-beta propeptide